MDMGTLEPESHGKRQLDDSGCVQDESQPTKWQACDGAIPPPRPGLLDLSDDVLFLILRHCKPNDLKALGFTCERLGNVISDHMLWQEVEATGIPYGKKRFGWLLNNVLNPMTRVLTVCGYAKVAKGCQGINPPRDDDEAEVNVDTKRKSSRNVSSKVSKMNKPSGAGATTIGRKLRPRSTKLPSNLGSAALSRFISAPCWPEADWEDEPNVEMESTALSTSCPGPIFTVNTELLSQLKAKCINLTSLSLEYCNINAQTTSMKHFPETLKRFSLRGSRVYNVPANTSYLNKIHDYLLYLEYIDVSECDWLEGASLLPLSKIANLNTLIMRCCWKMCELVAYASLAARYGFRKLQVIDLRLTPFGDSEVSSLGWLPELRELYISPAPQLPPHTHHSHNIGDVLPALAELEPWETQEPEYFCSKQTPADSAIEDDDSESEPEQQPEQGKFIVNKVKPYRWDPRMLRVQTLHCKEMTHRTLHREVLLNVPNCVNGNDGDANRNQDGEQNQNCEQSENADENQTGDELQNDYKISQNESQIQNAKDQDGHLICDNAVKYNCASTQDNLKQNDDLKQDGVSPNTINPELDHRNKSGPSKRKAGDSSDDHHDVPLKKTCQVGINDGASTSKDDNAEDNNIENGAENSQEKKNNARFVRFQRSADPVVLRMPENSPEMAEFNHHLRGLLRQNMRRFDVQAMQRIVYVTVGRQLRTTIYQLAIENESPMRLNQNNAIPVRDYISPMPLLDTTSLVTDSAVRRFGRADNENVNYVHIGPNGPVPIPAGEIGTRPNRSNLRILSITGFETITDRSLVHLATAAPHLTFLDLSRTRVTPVGVETFKASRPDCEVKFSEFVNRP